jgi:transcriptional regulator with PAS, ATPase and Fis domain
MEVFTVGENTLHWIWFYDVNGNRHDFNNRSGNKIQRPEGPNLKAIQEANEKEQILKTLREVKYNKSKAAKLLNIDRKTLYHKLSKYNIND